MRHRRFPKRRPTPICGPLLKIIGQQSHVTPIILQLSRWIGEYYCCPPEIALKTVLPEAVRKEKDGWREQLFVRALPVRGASPGPKLSKRQEQILKSLAGTARIAVAGVVDARSKPPPKPCGGWKTRACSPSPRKISERDPYARETILPTQPLAMNAEQARALAEITAALDGRRSRTDKEPFLLHGVTGSGKTEVYLQAIALALEQGKGAIVLVPEISLDPANGGALQGALQFRAACKRLVAVLHSHFPPANAMMNGIKSARAAPASPSGPARPCLRRSIRWG